MGRSLVLMILVMSLAQRTPAAFLHGIEFKDMHPQADACTDFYDYANGSWRAQHPIPPAASRWSRRQEAHDDNWHRQQTVLQSLARNPHWPSGSAEQIAGDHYAACMNESAVEAAGLQPVAKWLAQLSAVRTRVDVMREIRRLHEIGVPVGFSAASTPGFHDPTHVLENIAAGELGLERDDYLGHDARAQDARALYQVHLAKLLTLSGTLPEEATSAAAGVLALELRLAAASLDATSAADPAATDHTMAFAGLKTLAPHLEWDRYFDEAKMPHRTVNVAEPRLLQALDQALVATPVGTWRQYLKVQLLEAFAPSLASSLANEHFAFVRSLGKEPDKERAQRCVESTDSLFGDALAKAYVATYFPPPAKAKAQAIVHELRTVLRQEIQAVAWMQPETKAMALKKLDATDVQVGYPEHFKEYAAIQVRRDDFFGNVMAGRRFNVAEDRRQVGTLTRRDFWLATPTPSSADAYILVELNKMVLPAGFLQPPFFDASASDAVNFGAMGVSVAHDLTHFIDRLGAANDVNGMPRNWWSDADRDAFARRGQCVADQYEGYFIEPGTHLNGQQVLGESVADIAGVHVAFLALKNLLEQQPQPSIDGFTPEQQFFISWGQVTGAAMRLDAQRQWVRKDPHPVPQYRVVGPLANSPEFMQTFSCPATAIMVRPPDKRCKVW
jgi:endothelin-converting enzyme/putative endopeptidase